MKKLVTLLSVLAVFSIIYYNITTSLSNKATVEAYCSTVHAHNVADYKACRVLAPTQILDKLTKAEINRYSSEVPTISLTPLK